MKRYSLPLFFIFLLISGCATGASYSKPGINFSNYKKVAITRLDCSIDKYAGQEVADIIALEFIKSGYDVIERSQLKNILNEEELIMVGITDQTKTSLRLKGVTAIITGSLSRYDCNPDKVVAVIGFTPISIPTNNCHASLSLKMLDVNTGELLWAFNGAHAKNDSSMTAHKVLMNLINTINMNIPAL